VVGKGLPTSNPHRPDVWAYPDVAASTIVRTESKRICSVLPNESRLSCGALKKNSFHNLRAPSASSAC